MSTSINQVARALFALSLGAATACSKAYDDAPLRERIDKVESVVSSAEARAASLAKDLEAIRQLANAVKNRNEITAVKEQRDASGQITTFVISFAKGSDVTIRMGTAGKDAIPPKISILQHSDGHYYWQVGGKPLLDASGRMYRADGDLGKTPRLRIERDEWQASYDEGRSWVSLGPAKGPKGASAGGESLFASINHNSDADYVTFKFKSGEPDLIVPRRQELQIKFMIPEGTIISPVYYGPYVDYTIPFTITGNVDGLRVYLERMRDSSNTVEYREGERSGKLHIRNMEHSMALIAVRGNKRYIFTFTIEPGVVRVASKSVEISGLVESRFELPVRTNVSYKVDIPEEDRSWLSVSDARAAMRNETLRFTAKPNQLLAPRKSWIRLTDAYGNELERFFVEQTAAEDQESSVEVTLGAGRSFFDIYQEISTNSWATWGGYYKLGLSIHRLKVRGTPTEEDWIAMYQGFNLCRILDLSEASISVIPAGTFTSGDQKRYSVEYIIFPRSLQRIESKAFCNHMKLYEVQLPQGVAVAPDAFENTPVSAKIRR